MQMLKRSTRLLNDPIHLTLVPQPSDTPRDKHKLEAGRVIREVWGTEQREHVRKMCGSSPEWLRVEHYVGKTPGLVR